jgi:hypothetical protein
MGVGWVSGEVSDLVEHPLNLRFFLRSFLNCHKQCTLWFCEMGDLFLFLRPVLFELLLSSSSFPWIFPSHVKRLVYMSLYDSTPSICI